MVTLSDVTAESVRWLWPGYIPYGKLTMLEGDPGVGKTLVSCAIAAAVSRGHALPGGEPARPADVVLLTYEDGLGDTIRPRLDAAGADTTRIHALGGIQSRDGTERLPTLPHDLISLHEGNFDGG